MTIKERYFKGRHLIKNGDFIFFSGTGLIASVIKDADQSPISHVGRVIELYGRLLIIDSNALGNHPEWLSSRIEGYSPNSDISIIRSNKNGEVISGNVASFINRSDDERTKYDFKNGIRELINRKFNLDFKISLDKSHNICSQSVRKDFEDLEMCTNEFKKLPIAFPFDYFRYRNINNTSIISL